MTLHTLQDLAAGPADPDDLACRAAPLGAASCKVGRQQDRASLHERAAAPTRSLRARKRHGDLPMRAERRIRLVTSRRMPEDLRRWSARENTERCISVLAGLRVETRREA
jgi:hypothetical protein